MANESKFKAGQMYGAEDINNTIAFMTTEGVLDISTPNEICKSLLETGISNQDKRMAVSIVDGKVHVSNGSCIMYDGSTYTIYEDGETLDFTPGALNYVYVVIDNTILKNVVKCTITEPPEDAVVLAEINANGTITDKRVYSRYKFPVYNSDVNDKKIIEASTNTGYIEVDLGGTDYQRFVFRFFYKPYSNLDYQESALAFFGEDGSTRAVTTYGKMGVSTNRKQIWVRYDPTSSAFWASVDVEQNIMKITFLTNANGTQIVTGTDFKVIIYAS